MDITTTLRIADSVATDRARKEQEELLKKLACALIENSEDANTLLCAVWELINRSGFRNKRHSYDAPKPRVQVPGRIVLHCYPTRPQFDTSRPAHEEAVATIEFVFPDGVVIVRIKRNEVLLHDATRSLTLTKEGGIWRYSSPRGFRSTGRAAGRRYTGATADPGRS